MKEKIKEILEQHLDENIHGKQNTVHKVYFDSIAEEIVKLFAIPVVVGQSEQLCDHPRSERSYIGQNMLRCNKCGKEFS